MTSPRKLLTFEHKGKVWTVDPRLQEFRFLVFGEMPEFVPFESKRGREVSEVLKREGARSHPDSD